MRHAVVAAMILTFYAGATAPPARAQLATRTWVSATGNDANACTRTSPCATFAGALAKTAAKGEIDALDAGNFGFVQINKSITIDGLGVASITALDRTNSLTVNAGDDDVVSLRNLQINGAASGGIGIVFYNARQVVIENCTVSDFLIAGILVMPSPAIGPKNLVVSNSTISSVAGEDIYSAGIRAQAGITTVSHSLISGNNIGLAAEQTGVINADSNTLTGNGTAVLSQTRGGGPIRLSNNDVYGNLTGFGCISGAIASDGTNRKGNNSGGITFRTCAPTETITEQ